MSRAFNGTTDTITVSAGNAPLDQGPITIIILAKAANTSGFTGWFIRGRNDGSPVWSALTSNNTGPKLFVEGDFGNGVAGLTTDWAYYVATVPDGGGIPNWHVKNVTTDSAWAHDPDDFSVSQGSGPIDDIIVGQNFPLSIAVAAAVPAEWSEGEVEANCTLAAADLHTAIGSSGWMVRFNQSSTATSVTDDTGGGGDQTALSGTTVDADDPPGFDYSLAAPSGPTVTVWDGAAEVAATVTVWDGTTEVTASVDQVVT